MKRHLTTSAVNMRRQDSSATQLDELERVPLDPDPPGTAVERELVLTSVSAWSHTLILTGELTHRSAHALDVEIERLCEEGVTEITVDLRDLEGIDPVGVAVIAFRCGLCEKRGYGFRLIRGSQSVQRAFEHAGVLAMLPFQDGDEGAARLGEEGHRSLDVCEQ